MRDRERPFLTYSALPSMPLKSKRDPSHPFPRTPLHPSAHAKAPLASHPKSGFEFRARAHWEGSIWVDLIAVQSGLTAWTPSQEVHGYSHDTETRAHNQYTDRFVVGRASTWIKIWGYTAKTEMTYDTDLAWPHLTTPAPAPRAQQSPTTRMYRYSHT